jgi:hypothetical protein
VSFRYRREQAILRGISIFRRAQQHYGRGEESMCKGMKMTPTR